MRDSLLVFRACDFDPLQILRYYLLWVISRVTLILLPDAYHTGIL